VAPLFGPPCICAQNCLIADNRPSRDAERVANERDVYLGRRVVGQFSSFQLVIRCDQAFSKLSNLPHQVEERKSHEKKRKTRLEVSPCEY